MGRNSLKHNTLAKRRAVKKIAVNFFNCYQKLKGENPRLDEDFKKEIGYTAACYRYYIDKVERAFRKLDELSKMFINNDFFYCAYPYWWVDKFPTSSYYRLKANAVDNFLRYFNEA